MKSGKENSRTSLYSKFDTKTQGCHACLQLSLARMDFLDSHKSFNIFKVGLLAHFKFYV